MKWLLNFLGFIVLLFFANAYSIANTVGEWLSFEHLGPLIGIILCVSIMERTNNKK